MPAILSPSLPPAVPEEPVMRLSVSQYRALVEGGLLTDDDRVELLEGWLIPKMSKNPPHRLATRNVRLALEGILPTGWFVESQEPLTLADSEPEPDLSVVRGIPTDYGQHHPGVADLGLVVEIADASLSRDRRLKLRVYGRAGIVTYWIVNLIDRQVEVYTDPTGPVEPAGYGQRQDYLAGSAVPVVLDGIVVGQFDVNSLLP